MARLSEDLLQHIWKHRLFSASELTTTEGQRVEILNPGTQNTDSGPDFLNARIKIDGTVWAGNIEMHVAASDWARHGHQNDPVYDNIILHAVFDNDLVDSVGRFPTVELRHYISDQIIARYAQIRNGTGTVLCKDLIAQVEPVITAKWFESLLVQRLARKSEEVNEILQLQNGDLEQAFQIALFRAFGTHINKESFDQLANCLHWKVLAKHRDQPVQLEALLFGCAGMLSGKTKDEYQQSLKDEFAFLQHKYGLKPMKGHMWRFLRMNPANFPTVRISQLAMLYHELGPTLKWFSSVSPDLVRMRVATTDYWSLHYVFGKPSRRKSKFLGLSMLRNVLINAVAPFLVVLAEREFDDKLKTRALDMLEALPPEKNRKVHDFTEAGLACPDAFTSQAMIELRSEYCEYKKCLFCAIGSQILKQ